MDGNQAPEQQPGWQYTPDGASEPAVIPQAPVAPQANTPTHTGDSVAWTASEFIAHQKDQRWYMMLGGGAVVATIIVYVLTRDFVSSGFILVAAVAFGILAGRQPRELGYQVNNTGLTIGSRFLPYSAFRSFSVMHEGAFTSIVFVPLKRFAPLTTIYYDPKDEEKIIAVLADHLPNEQRQADAVDRLMWRIRF